MGFAGTGEGFGGVLVAMAVGFGTGFAVVGTGGDGLTTGFGGAGLGGVGLGGGFGSKVVEEGGGSESDLTFFGILILFNTLKSISLLRILLAFRFFLIC